MYDYFQNKYFRNSDSGYSSEAQALFNAVDLPSQVKPYYASLIDAFVSVGAWDSIKIIACTPGIDHDDYTIDLKSLTKVAKFQKPGDITGLRSTANTGGSAKGYNFTGTDAHIDTGYIASDIQSTNDYCTIIVTYNSVNNSTTFTAGASDGVNSTLFTPRRTTDQLWWQSWDSSANGRIIQTSATGEAGVYMINRKASNDVDIYVNGSVVKTATTVSGSVCTVAEYLNTFNNNGTPSTRSNNTRICLYAQLGSSLSDADAVTLSTAIQTWQTNMQMIEGSFDKQVILDGNSHTVVMERQFPRNYERELAASGWDFTNLGVAGQTTAQMEADASSQVDPLYNGAYSKNILMVMECTNDAHANGFAAAKTNITTYVTNRKAAGFYVIVCQIMARTSGSNFDGYTQEQYDLATDDFNTWLDAGNSGADAIITTPNKYFVYRSAYGSDAAYTAAMSALRADSAYYYDGVHGTEVGYRLFKDNQVTAIQAV